MQPVSVAILAGGESNRFRQAKALTLVAGKPLFLHVVDASEAYASEIFIVVHSDQDRDAFSKHFPEEQIITDVVSEFRCPLVGALSAFRHAKYPFTQLFPCDSPLIHPMYIEIMWGMIENHHAAVPRWPNGWVEPLHSIFDTSLAQEIATSCLEKQEPRMQCLIENIGRVIFLSTSALERFDSKLRTFTNVNTPGDLRRIEQLLRRKLVR
ncbi:MAG: molybdenum cofactor guanylyltransferase [Candidatus Hermodarchaeota archaeon]|nr:molybdenum cofactor guanylyltransferase [Candidatus Hermodarchaeota archaeon]